MLLLSDRLFDQLTCPLISFIPYTRTHAHVKTTAPMYCETNLSSTCRSQTFLQLSRCTTIHNAKYLSIIPFSIRCAATMNPSPPP
jgi:hypothetical protein